MFGAIQAALTADPALGKKVSGSLQFHITGGSAGADWYVDTKACVSTSGKAPKADCTITIAEKGTTTRALHLSATHS